LLEFITISAMQREYKFNNPLGRRPDGLSESIWTFRKEYKYSFRTASFSSLNEELFMKMAKSLLAISVFVALQAHASTYNVTGNMTGSKVIGATSIPTLTYKHGPSNVAGMPTFGGIWDINTGVNSIVGGIDFEQFTVGVSAIGGALTANITQSNSVYNIGGGTVSYNAATHVLTVGQVLTYSSASGTSNGSLNWNTVANPAIGATAAVNGTCSGSSLICNGQTAQFLSKPNKEQFYLTLTFDGVGDIFSHFTGSAVGVDIGGATGGSQTGNQWESYTFQGTANAPTVPVPATAWLFGSGVLGLAGVARRRRAV